MDKKTLRDVDLKGKRVVMRVDFNVPVKDGVIKDDTRIKGALPSIKYVLEQGGSLVLMSHMGRPDEKGITPDTSLKIVADYLSNLLGQGLTAAKKAASTSLMGLVSTGVNMIGDMVRSKKNDWSAAVARENVFVKTLPMMENIEDFYSDVSFAGALDPSSLSFNGFGCLQKRDNDTVLYMVCHLDTTEYGVGRILKHSKFELTLDTLVFNPYKCDLPNDSTMPYSMRVPFSFTNRDNLNLQISLNVMSSWINQAIQLHRDQTLGQFFVNVPINENTLDADSVFRFYRGSSNNKAVCDITGESFIVPRSYIGVRDANGRFHDAWGTGQYKMSMTLRETCSNTEAFDKNWKADWKARKMNKGHKVDFGRAMRQLWDANGSKWVMSIVEAPAKMLTQDFLATIGFLQPQATGAAAMGAMGASGAAMMKTPSQQGTAGKQ